GTVDYSLIRIAKTEGGHECSATETDYFQATTTSYANTTPTISISGASVVDRCETISLRININSGRPFDIYEALLEVDLGNGYVFTEDLAKVTFHGLYDTNGDPIAAFLPTLSGGGDLDGTLTWNLGDLREG